MPVNDANCLMMSQQLLEAVKRLFTLEKSCASCLQMAKAVKLSPVGKCTTYLKLVWKRFDKILISLPLNRIPNFSSCWSDRTQIVDFECKTDFPFLFQMTPVEKYMILRKNHKCFQTAEVWS